MGLARFTHAFDYYKTLPNGTDLLVQSTAFAYQTTPLNTWPMFIGHLVQVLFGWDKKWGLQNRVVIGYSVFLLCAVAIILQDALDLSARMGATIVLICFGVIRLTNELQLW